MALFLTAFAIGLICAVGSCFIYDDGHLLGRRVPAAVIVAIGFGLAICADPKQDGTQELMGLMVAAGGILLGFRLSRGHEHE